jgi:hypothetical protein
MATNNNKSGKINQSNGQKSAIMLNDAEKAAKIAELEKKFIILDDDRRLYNLLSSNTIKRRFKPCYIDNLERKIEDIKDELSKLKGEDDESDSESDSDSDSD